LDIQQSRTLLLEAVHKFCDLMITQQSLSDLQFNPKISNCGYGGGGGGGGKGQYSFRFLETAVGACLLKALKIFAETALFVDYAHDVIVYCRVLLETVLSVCRA
jgi:hypothetical protein